MSHEIEDRPFSSFNLCTAQVKLSRDTKQVLKTFFFGYNTSIKIY